jgi:transposase-like protein
MAPILSNRATTTPAIRAEIQRPTESAATLSRRYGINLKTLRKWRSRDTVGDTRMGPRPLVPRR